MLQTEHDIQKSVCEFLDLALPRDAVYWATPNGGHRHKAVAAKLKAEGVKSGIPDLFVVWGGLFVGIEMKTAKGRQSSEQKEVQSRLQFAGLGYYVCRSPEDVERALRDAGVPLRLSMIGAGGKKAA